MRRVGPNSFTEIYFAGCNPSFVETSDGYVMIDSPQQPIDAVRWREQLEEKAPIRYLINTEPHGDHIAGNAYFTKTTVVGQVKLQECFDRYLNAFGSLDDKRERYKQMDPDSVWLVGHPDYPASNPPTLTFTDTLTLNVGNHTFNIIHHPGHTAPQTSVHVPEEGWCSPVTTSSTNAAAGCRNATRGSGWRRSTGSPRSMSTSSCPAMASLAARPISRNRRRSSRIGSGSSSAMSSAASAPRKS
jgi:hypothetical protein